MKKWLFLCPLLWWASCGDSNKKPSAPPAPVGNYSFAYTTSAPDTTFLMPDKLVEISGLGLSPDGRYLLANNDEDGVIFFLDKTNGTVVQEIKFDGPDDYEGIESVGETIYVVKSNGNIYEVKNPGLENHQTVRHKTFLTREQDVEGLGYDPNSGYLLLACKGKAGQGKDFKRKRAVYAFDISRAELLKDPFLLIDLDDIKKWAGGGQKNITQKLAEFFEPGLADDAFAPSGIALHPLTGEIYILSSFGKILVVLNPDGQILHIEPLDPKLYRQPEGICFDRDGTMFIANEGNGGSGKLMRFGMSGS